MCVWYFSPVPWNLSSLLLCLIFPPMLVSSPHPLLLCDTRMCKHGGPAGRVSVPKLISHLPLSSTSRCTPCTHTDFQVFGTLQDWGQTELHLALYCLHFLLHFCLASHRAVTWISRASFTLCWDPRGQSKKGAQLAGTAGADLGRALGGSLGAWPAWTSAALSSRPTRWAWLSSCIGTARTPSQLQSQVTVQTLPQLLTPDYVYIQFMINSNH